MSQAPEEEPRLTLNLQVDGRHQGWLQAAIAPFHAARSFHVTDAVRPSRRLGIIGSTVGLLALLVSALTHLLPDSLLHSPTWEQGLLTATVSLGLFAIVFAVLAVIFREERRLAGIAAILGAAAIAVQVWWVLILVVLAMMIANTFLP